MIQARFFAILQSKKKQSGYHSSRYDQTITELYIGCNQIQRQQRYRLNGLLLLLSMEERDFSLITHGDYGDYVFDQDTREAMADYFLDDFSYDAWYDGFAYYLSVSNDILADGPDKLQSEINALTGTIFLVPLIPAAIGVFILGRKMKSVAAATQAAAYVSGVPELTVSEDRYTHTTEVRRKIKDEDSDQSSGGGVRSRSSGSFSGTSGKF